MNRRIFVVICLFPIFVMLIPDRPSSAVELFQLDDFQDGTTDGWLGGASPINLPTGGPDGAGDAYLEITSTGAIGPGSRLATRNETLSWTGNYSDAGAQRISVDMLNPNASELSVRAVLVNSLGSRWTSTDSFQLPADGVWQKLEFFLFESELSHVAGIGAYADVIQDVAKVILRHDKDGPSADGTPIAAKLQIDNVRLMPGGDFDDDGQVNESDVDALVAAIATGADPEGFDLNGDGAVNGNDLDEWLRLAGHLNLPSRASYPVGDATLDGQVDGSDFLAWNDNKFTATAAWTAGDFDANGFVDGRDFLLWNGNKFTSVDAVNTVPEPGFDWVWMVFLICIRLLELWSR